MAIIKQYHADTDTTYVYESTSYWDTEKGQSRSKRHVIGKLDPVTGEVIPTGKRGRKKKEPSASQPSESPDPCQDSSKRIMELQMENAMLKNRVTELESDIRKYKSAAGKIQSLTEKISSLCSLRPES